MSEGTTGCSMPERIAGNAGGKVVVVEDRAGIEALEDHAVALALDRLEGELLARRRLHHGGALSSGMRLPIRTVRPAPSRMRLSVATFCR
jgi:hypothetical protein